MNNTSINKNRYFPQLDALRAFAVILVIISHWFSDDHFLNRYSANGSLGVTLFFVLSGFLITGILLDYKEKIKKGISVLQGYKIFYARRSLRIFPVYYVLLFVLLILNIASISKSFYWHFFYGSNFYFWMQGHFEGSLSHFWSLAVEEQFYLIWPAVIFFVPKSKLPLIFLCGIIGAIIFRMLITTPGNDIGRILMPGSLDSFCIGGTIALARLTKTKQYLAYIKNRNIFLIFSLLVLFSVHTPLFRNLSYSIQTACSFFIISVVFGMWIDKAADGVNFKPLKVLFENKLLLYIGKISYGLYLFHNFIPYFYGLKLPGIPVSFQPYVIQLLRFLLLIFISTFSWYLIERPFLSLKDKFVLKLKERV